MITTTHWRRPSSRIGVPLLQKRQFYSLPDENDDQVMGLIDLFPLITVTPRQCSQAPKAYGGRGGWYFSCTSTCSLERPNQGFVRAALRRALRRLHLAHLTTARIMHDVPNRVLPYRMESKFGTKAAQTPPINTSRSSSQLTIQQQDSMVAIFAVSFNSRNLAPISSESEYHDMRVEEIITYGLVFYPDCGT